MGPGDGTDRRLPPADRQVNRRGRAGEQSVSPAREIHPVATR